MLSLFGLVVFIGIFGGMLWATARRWRYLAKNYAKAIDPPLEKRNFQSAVLLGLGGFNTVKGILTIGVHQAGVSFNILTPFSLFHSPLFIPYEDIRGWETSWYLDGRSTELELIHAPEVKLIVPMEQAEWIKSFAGQKMMLRDVSPPNGKAGRGWYGFSLANAGISLVMVAWLCFYLLTGQQF